MKVARRSGCWLPRSLFFLAATVIVALSNYVQQVSSLPAEADLMSQWPTFPRRNVAALARDGYLRTPTSAFKRSISILAKNGLLPTFRSPNDESDGKQEGEEEESQEKRNVGSIARLRSYSAMKRNVQALAREGYRPGRQVSQQNDKRNLAALARNGLLHKRDEEEEEYFYPFYQNQVPPLSEMDGPFDVRQIYDYQQSVNPDMFPPLSQVFKRSYFDDNEYYDVKRGPMGSPVHGLYRDAGNSKRFILTLPDYLDRGEFDGPIPDEIPEEEKRSVEDHSDDVHENFEKRHIGSLARLGLLPSFRFTGGRYSRSGRARLLMRSREMYRKHSPDENFGIREYLTGPEADPATDPDDSYVPAPAVLAQSHPTGRLFRRPLNNDLPLPLAPSPPQPSPQLSNLPHPNLIDTFSGNRWKHSKEVPKFYYFRSLKVPYHTSEKRYLLLPAVDNIMLRKAYPNGSLPSRRKNQ